MISVVAEHHDSYPPIAAGTARYLRRKGWALCHELRLYSLRRCATVREMKEVLRVRQSGVDLKPPQAAVVKSHGGELGESRDMNPVRRGRERRA